MACDDELDALENAVEAYQRAQQEYSAALHNLIAAIGSLGSGLTSIIDCLVEVFEGEEETGDIILDCVQAALNGVSGEEWVHSAAESLDLEVDDLRNAANDFAEANSDFIHCVSKAAASSVVWRRQ